jgi:hypothetical protein
MPGGVIVQPAGVLMSPVPVTSFNMTTRTITSPTWMVTGIVAAAELVVPTAVTPSR